MNIKKTNSQPSLPGSFILSHSKRLMNDVVISLDGFKNIKVYYTDTDSIDTHNDDYELLKSKNLIGKDLHQCKNDYGKSDFLCGLILAPKLNYCTLIEEKVILSQRTTFKGYDQNMVGLKFENFFVWRAV